MLVVMLLIISSDERFKDLITPIENPNEKIKLLRVTLSYGMTNTKYIKVKKILVLLQRGRKILQEIVETREDGYKRSKIRKDIALLIESNKELIKRVEELESKSNKCTMFITNCDAGQQRNWFVGKWFLKMLCHI